MTSADLKAEGFASWGKFNRAAKHELMRLLPSCYAVYVVRSRTPIQRKRGESDLVYVGSACNQNGLKGRIGQYYSPGPSQPTNRRILALVENSDDYELGWCKVDRKSEALELEQRILERYTADHDERPPQNLKG